MGGGGVAEDYFQVVAFYQLAAEQAFDGAHLDLDYMCNNGFGVAQD